MPTTIEYKNYPNRLRQYADPFGRLFLDVSLEFEIRITRAMQTEEISRTQISQSASLAGDLPATPKNRAILDQFRGDAVNRNRTWISVEVIQDGERLPLTGGALLSYDDENKTYAFELFGDDWITALSEITLRDLDLPEYEYTEANVLATWTGPVKLWPCPAWPTTGPGIRPGAGVRKI